MSLLYLIFIIKIRIFCSTHQEKYEDFQFDYTLGKFSFITLKHMEVDKSSVDNDYLEVAINSKNKNKNKNKN